MADIYAAYVDDSEAPPGEPRINPAELKPRKEGIMAICNKIGLPCIAPRRKINVMIVGNHSAGKSSSELTRTPRPLRWVRTGYAYQPPALCTYRTRRAACPQSPTYCTYWVRVPASTVRYVPRTVALQVEMKARLPGQSTMPGLWPAFWIMV